MKNCKLPGYLSSLVLLISSVSLTSVAQASAAAGGAGAAGQGDVVKAIKELDTYGGGESSIRELISKYYKDWADAAAKEYDLKKEFHFMPAPGTEQAISVGINIKENTEKNYASQFVNDIFQRSVSAFWPQENAEQNQSEEQLAATLKMRFYNLMLQGMSDNTEQQQALNMGTLLNKNKVEKQAAEDFIGYMTSPRSKLNRDVIDKIKNGTELSLSEKEEIGEKFIELMNMAPSVNALSELFARRIVTEGDAEANDQSKTKMELMEEYSDLRFNTPEWYALISKSSDAALLREIAHLMAYNTWVQKEAYKLKEQEVSLLATMNANISRMLTAMDAFYEQLDAADDVTRRQAIEAEKKIRDMRLQSE